MKAKSLVLSMSDALPCLDHELGPLLVQADLHAKHDICGGSSEQPCM